MGYLHPKHKDRLNSRHMQVKDTAQDDQSNQNLCVTISMQKISSIHKFILQIQQIPESHEPKDHAHF